MSFAYMIQNQFEICIYLFNPRIALPDLHICNS